LHVAANEHAHIVGEAMFTNI